MTYTGTRNSAIRVTAAEAIVKGISPDGGLFVPESRPALSADELKELTNKSYTERAEKILGLFLPEFGKDDLRAALKAAYEENFDKEGAVDLSKLGEAVYALELWHGPTAAFKDMALQLMPRLLKLSLQKTGNTNKTLILVATSGDTGKAALEGFKDAENIEIAVFYPEYGVSDMQKLQMATQEGANVRVIAVKGNFDDCQNGVKAVFTDADLIRKAAEKNIEFSSANSINWGRLCPQIAYYVSAYAELVKRGEITFGEKVNVSVPTGNFGNILAAYYAKEMGVPLGKLICASNSNNVLTDFINTGAYDRNREFFATVSPSMDILISSNLERLLFHLSGNDGGIISEWFSALKSSGKFQVGEAVKQTLLKDFYAGWCDEDETKSVIKRVFEQFGYLIDPHTAVGYKVWEDYARENGDYTKTILAGTANPYKFSAAVYEAITGETPTLGGFELIERLEKLTGVPCPKSLTAIKNKPVRFTESVGKDEITDYVGKIL